MREEKALESAYVCLYLSITGQIKGMYTQATFSLGENADMLTIARACENHTRRSWNYWDQKLMSRIYGYPTSEKLFASHEAL